MGGGSIPRPRGLVWGSRLCARGSKAWVGCSRWRVSPARARRSGSPFLWGAVLELLDVYDALPDGVDDGLGPVEDVQLPVDVRGVVAHGLLRDAEGTGDLTIAHALRQGPYTPQLPPGERRGRELRAPGSAALEGVEHLLGEVGGDDGVPRVDRVDGVREVLGLRVL